MRLTALLVLLIAVFLVGCGTQPAPEKTLVLDLTARSTASTNGYLDIAARPMDANFQFAADGGRLAHTEDRFALWQAPSTPGTYTITITGDRENQRAILTHEVTVVDPPFRIQSVDVQEILDAKVAALTIENRNDRSIVAIRGRMVVLDHFGERIWYQFRRSLITESVDLSIPPGSSSVIWWSLSTTPGGRTVFPWIYEIAYDDGSTWRLYN